MLYVAPLVTLKFRLLVKRGSRFNLEPAREGIPLVQQYIRSAYPTNNWKNDKGGNIITLEPRPIIVSGHLYWMVTITNDQFAGITKSVIVDAQSGDIREFISLSEVNQFIAGTYTGTPVGGTPVAPTTPTKSLDVKHMSPPDLYKALQQIIDELRSRQNIK